MKKIKAKLKFFWIKTKEFVLMFKREGKETVIASKILLKITRGEEVTPEQIDFLKKQSVDFGKAVTLIGFQFVPGSSLAIIAIESAGKKYGFSVFPKDQVDPEMKSKE